jgi:GGDEF domain-containing protein
MGAALICIAVLDRLANVSAWLGSAPTEVWFLLGGVLAAGILVARERRGAPAWEQLGTPALPSYRSTLPRLGQELARMRRYERPLAVVVLRTEVNGADPHGGNGKGGSGVDAGTLAFCHAGAILRDLLRDTDLLACDLGHRRYVVVLPETNREQAELAAVRLQNRLSAAIPLPLSAGISEFPTDGLIVEELVKKAVAACGQHRLAVH